MSYTQNITNKGVKAISETALPLISAFSLFFLYFYFIGLALTKMPSLFGLFCAV
jgi:hypothetical protein